MLANLTHAIRQHAGSYNRAPHAPVGASLLAYLTYAIRQQAGSYNRAPHAPVGASLLANLTYAIRQQAGSYNRSPHAPAGASLLANLPTPFASKLAPTSEQARPCRSELAREPPHAIRQQAGSYNRAPHTPAGASLLANLTPPFASKLAPTSEQARPCRSELAREPHLRHSPASWLLHPSKRAPVGASLLANRSPSFASELAPTTGLLRVEGA